MTPNEYAQRETDYHRGLHEERQRFRAPPLELPSILEQVRVPMTLAEFQEACDEATRADDAADQLLNRNGIPPLPATRVVLFK